MKFHFKGGRIQRITFSLKVQSYIYLLFFSSFESLPSFRYPCIAIYFSRRFCSGVISGSINVKNPILPPVVAVMANICENSRTNVPFLGRMFYIIFDLFFFFFVEIPFVGQLLIEMVHNNSAPF